LIWREVPVDSSRVACRLPKGIAAPVQPEKSEPSPVSQGERDRRIAPSGGIGSATGDKKKPATGNACPPAAEDREHGRHRITGRIVRPDRDSPPALNQTAPVLRHHAPRTGGPELGTPEIGRAMASSDLWVGRRLGRPPGLRLDSNPPRPNTLVSTS